MNITPTVGLKGLYELITPFATEPTSLYTCHAVRSFTDLLERDIDPYDEYYVPYGLDNSTYQSDKVNRVSIVTLISEEGDIIYVPTSYIANMPSTDNVNYHNVILSVNLGALPEYVDLSNTKEEIEIAVGKVIGKTPTVKEHLGKADGAITPDQHQVLEATRLSAIDFNATAHGRYHQLLQQNLELMDRIGILQDILIEKGWLQ